MLYKVQTAVVPGSSVPLQISGPGKYFKLISAARAGSLIFSADNALTTPITPGRQIAFGKTVNQCTLINAGTDSILIQFYFGDEQFYEVPRTNPGQSIISVDWVTVPALATFTLTGQILARGTKYERRKATLTNITGTGMPGVNVAAYGAIETIYGLYLNNVTTTGGYSKSAGASLNGGIYPLAPGSATSVQPVVIETQDDITIISLNGATVDVSILVEWVPVAT